MSFDLLSVHTSTTDGIFSDFQDEDRANELSAALEAIDAWLYDETTTLPTELSPTFQSECALFKEKFTFLRIRGHSIPLLSTLPDGIVPQHVPRCNSTKELKLTQPEKDTQCNALKSKHSTLSSCLNSNSFFFPSERIHLKNTSISLSMSSFSCSPPQTEKEKPCLTCQKLTNEIENEKEKEKLPSELVYFNDQLKKEEPFSFSFEHPQISVASIDSIELVSQDPKVSSVSFQPGSCSDATIQPLLQTPTHLIYDWLEGVSTIQWKRIAQELLWLINPSKKEQCVWLAVQEHLVNLPPSYVSSPFHPSDPSFEIHLSVWCQSLPSNQFTFESIGCSHFHSTSIFILAFQAPYLHVHFPITSTDLQVTIDDVFFLFLSTPWKVTPWMSSFSSSSFFTLPLALLPGFNTDFKKRDAEQEQQEEEWMEHNDSGMEGDPLKELNGLVQTILTRISQDLFMDIYPIVHSSCSSSTMTSSTSLSSFYSPSSTPSSTPFFTSTCLRSSTTTSCHPFPSSSFVSSSSSSSSSSLSNVMTVKPACLHPKKPLKLHSTIHPTVHRSMSSKPSLLPSISLLPSNFHSPSSASPSLVPSSSRAWVPTYSEHRSLFPPPSSISSALTTSAFMVHNSSSSSSSSSSTKPTTATLYTPSFPFTHFSTPPLTFPSPGALSASFPLPSALTSHRSRFISPSAPSHRSSSHLPSSSMVPSFSPSSSSSSSSSSATPVRFTSHRRGTGLRSSHPQGAVLFSSSFSSSSSVAFPWKYESYEKKEKETDVFERVTSARTGRKIPLLHRHGV